MSAYEQMQRLHLRLPDLAPTHQFLRTNIVNDLVKLAKTGYVLLSGDVAHFRENLDTDGVPPFNHDPREVVGLAGPFQKDFSQSQGGYDYPA